MYLPTYLLTYLRGSHSFTCHPHTNHTCLSSPATKHHRFLAGTHSTYSWRDGQAEFTLVAVHTFEIGLRHRTGHPPSTNRAQRSISSMIETSALPLRQTATHTLALSLMNISLSLTKSLHCLNLFILTFINFAASVLILILKQLVPSPPPLFTLSLITATPSTSISLSLRQTLSSSSRILLLVLLLKLPNHVTSLLYLNLCTGSKLMNELTTSYSLLLTRFSLPHSLLTCITLSLSNLLAVLVLPLLLLLLALQPVPR